MSRVSSAPPPLLYLSPPSPEQSFNLDSKITPSILLIIIILAIIFFVSGLLHLLVRCLLRPNQRDPDELDNVTALQGQLQHLFHLHDAGVDQSYIDTLPVFHYKAIIGVKDPFDCAVCLCEFEPEDKLRLLPKCSHAFHVDCIDTWLLSHSTCPLCRSSLLGDLTVGNDGFRNPIPIVCVLESGSVESSREIRVSVSDSEAHSGVLVDVGSGRKDGVDEEKIVTVKLGKFKNLDGGEGSSEEKNGNGNGNGNETNNSNGNDSNSNSNNLGSRRCYSMGSFAYVMDETRSLQVPIRTPMKKKPSVKKPGLPLKPGHRTAMSEYGSDSMREFNGIEAFRSIGDAGKGNESGRSKRESFSISKIWARGNRIANDCSSRRTISEIEIEIEEGVLGGDEETQSCYSVDSLAANCGSSTSSSNKRTLLWLMGRQNKVVHNHSSLSSSSSNV